MAPPRLVILGAVLAHQGGWDEILMVLTPISLFAGLLWMANRRANAQLLGTRADEPEGTDGPDEAAPGDGGQTETDPPA